MGPVAAPLLSGKPRLRAYVTFPRSPMEPEAGLWFRCAVLSFDLKSCWLPTSSLRGVEQTGEINGKPSSMAVYGLQTCFPFIISFDPHSNEVLLYSFHRGRNWSSENRGLCSFHCEWQSWSSKWGFLTWSPQLCPRAMRIRGEGVGKKEKKGKKKQPK